MRCKQQVLSVRPHRDADYSMVPDWTVPASHYSAANLIVIFSSSCSIKGFGCKFMAMREDVISCNPNWIRVEECQDISTADLLLAQKWRWD